MNVARPDRAFFLIAVAGSLAFVTVPRDAVIYERWYQLFLVGSVVATLVGVSLNGPRSRLPWFLIALGGLCGVTADAVRGVQLDRYAEAAFPSVADFISLGSYVAIAAALVAMIRMQAPGRDWPSLVDAAIVAVGVALVSWTIAVLPRLTESSGAFETTVALAFPIMDVLLVSLAARMVLGPGLRVPAFAMVTTALVFKLVGDALYGFGSLHGWYQRGDVMDLLFVFSAVLWGTAALHPSMVELTEPNVDPESRLSSKRLAVLSAATLTAPAMLAVAALRADQSELLVIVGAATALTLLVVVRLAGLVSRHERSERRERALSSAAANLVAAWTPGDIHRSAVEATLEILGGERASACMTIGGESGPEVVAATGALADRMRRDPLGELEDVGGARTVVPLVVQGDELGSLIVHTPEPPTPLVHDGLETLAAQVALALEGAALAESLHERQSAERFRSLVQNSSDVILLLSSDHAIRYHTPSVERVLGYEEDELIGVSLPSLAESGGGSELSAFLRNVRVSPGTPMPRDLLLRRKDGSYCQLETIFNNLLDDESVAGIVVTARDVTERRALEEQLAHQAFHDSLTGLANRALFMDRVTHALERARRRANLISVLLIDLDDFKTVNDSLGHAAGDELLVRVARTLEGCLRAEDSCARLGGDEFAILLEDVPALDGAVAVAQRLLDSIAQPTSVLGSSVVPHASIGVALGTIGQSPNELLRSADLAMYQAKSDGKASLAVFEQSMHERVAGRLAFKTDLERAVVEEAFELHYQPIVALDTGKIAGVEALVRWRHPERGLIDPDDFIPLAEETGLVLRLGRLVLEGACQQVASWRGRFDPHLGVAVNISAKQLSSPSLASEVTAILENASLPPDALTLEITESMLLDSESVIARLESLRAVGVRIAIDDFGTGYSSLNYLRRFPVDTLKVAGPFIAHLETQPGQQRLVSAILRLGSALGLTTVAEGIENAAQRDLLRKLDCHLGQGFLFSRPLPAHELDPLLEVRLVA
ncbi:MAG TPA: EAL domain-containing protein [Gaiellaceae bacterium]|nr:EAL domain-containing protein [Gaiellaceae bacterium]